ncbi:MAG: uroporphyrinogen decarboxylase family protein [Tepidisphaeraceae bacterium]|jgi:uroporphyrinogen decarboxylase
MTHRETMTSRQRVLAALNHREPDRVPIDLGGNQTGIHKVAYQSLLKHLGVCDLLTDTPFCEALLDQTLKFWMDWFRVFLTEVDDVVDVIMIGDDLAGQTGPLFNPDIYRSLVKPRHKALVQYIKSRTAAKIWYHTCGACSSFIPELMDNGINILNPVQISAAGMDPATLKSHYGKKLSFWGGAIDSQKVLPRATPEQIRQDVRRHLEVWKPGGGYVFNNVHNIQSDVSGANTTAFYDAAYEFGFYGR